MAAFDRAPAATCNTLRTYHLLSTGVTSATRSSSHGQGGGSPTSRGHHSLARSPLSTRVRAVFTVISYSPVAYTVNAASNRRRRLVPSRVASRRVRLVHVYVISVVTSRARYRSATRFLQIVRDRRQLGRRYVSRDRAHRRGNAVVVACRCPLPPCHASRASLVNASARCERMHRLTLCRDGE